MDRVRRTGFVTIDGHRHLIRLSEPDPSSVGHGVDAPLYAILPGLTEAADGITRHGQYAAASVHPDRRVLTIATDGVSVHGDSLPFGEALNHPFAGMALARQRLLTHLAGPKAPVILLGRSMGSVLATLTAGQNLLATSKFSLAGIQLLSPGVVAVDVPAHEAFRSPLESFPARVGALTRFLGHVGADLCREAPRHPVEAIEALGSIAALGVACALDANRAAAMGGNLRQLMGGVPWASIKSVAAAYKVAVLTGSRDSVGEVKQWQTLQKLYPNNVSLRVLAGKGHIMSLDALAMVRLFAVQ